MVRNQGAMEKLANSEDLKSSAVRQLSVQVRLAPQRKFEMKAKIPYNIVSAEAGKIIEKMITATSDQQAEEQWNLYVAYLEVCGWTDEELDEETLKQIDSSWQKKSDSN